MTAREDTIDRIERCLELTSEKSITVTIPRLTAERAVSMLKEQEEKIEHLNSITLEYEKEVFRLQNLLKEQEAVKPYMDFDGHDVWRCGKCGATIFHIYHNASDEDAKNYAKFCRHCGRAVKWDE